MRRRARIVLLVAGMLSLLGCASAEQEWVKPGAARIGRVAVLPFENQTTSLRAGQAAADLLVSQLLATGTIAVMDPSEVADLLRRENLDPADAARRRQGLRTEDTGKSPALFSARLFACEADARLMCLEAHG